jgi:hypothetical protein
VIWSATAGSTSRIFLSPPRREHRERRGRRGGADRERDAVVLLGFGERGLGDVRLGLVVLGDEDDLAPVTAIVPLGGVFEAQPQAGLGLLRVGLSGPVLP